MKTKATLIILFIFSTQLFVGSNRPIEDSFTSSWVPVISLITLILTLFFYLAKDSLGSTFRANKKATLVALLVISLVAWPFKYFKEDPKPKEPIEAKGNHSFDYSI